MDVFIEREKRTVTFQFKGKGSELLKRMGINPETVLLVKNKTVVTEDEALDDTDRIELLSVVSGG